MGKPGSRQHELSQVHFSPAHPGSRVLFLVEARTRKEVRQVRELFDMVGHLAEVVPVSHGEIMSYAVQVHGDTSLFGKIEWLLKTQFTFSLVERNLSDVTFQLVRSLCEDSQTEMAELPECGICSSVDPFPTRVTAEAADGAEPLHLEYCSRCSGRYAEENPEAFVRGLLGKDRRRFRIAREAAVILVPDIAAERPQWEMDAIAIAG